MVNNANIITKNLNNDPSMVRLDSNTLFDLIAELITAGFRISSQRVVDECLVRYLQDRIKTDFGMPAKEMIMCLLNELNDVDRYKIFSEYCMFCGTKDLPCSCERDD